MGETKEVGVEQKEKRQVSAQRQLGARSEFLVEAWKVLAESQLLGTTE